MGVDAGPTIIAAVLGVVGTMSGAVYTAHRDIGRKAKPPVVPPDQAPTDDRWHSLIDQDIGGLKQADREHNRRLGLVEDGLDLLRQVLRNKHPDIAEEDITPAEPEPPTTTRKASP